MKETFNNSKEAIKDRGEVFTPTPLVNEMLDKLPQDLFEDNKTFLDNSCGNGQFLYNVMKRKMSNGFTHEEALTQIYGVELDMKNKIECQKRLLDGSKDLTLIKIVKNNIICADALDCNHDGWSKVGFYWSKKDSYKSKLDLLLSELNNSSNEKEVSISWRNFMTSLYENGSFTFPHKCNGVFHTNKDILCEFVYSMDMTNKLEIVPIISKLAHYTKKLKEIPVRFFIADRNECCFVNPKDIQNIMNGNYEWEKFTPATAKKHKKLIEDLNDMVIKVTKVNSDFVWKKVIQNG